MHSPSTQLAAVFPRSGGTYEFGRHMLGPWPGYLAGWMFLAANTVGPGVSALVFVVTFMGFGELSRRGQLQF